MKSASVTAVVAPTPTPTPSTPVPSGGGATSTTGTSPSTSAGGGTPPNQPSLSTDKTSYAIGDTLTWKAANLNPAHTYSLVAGVAYDVQPSIVAPFTGVSSQSGTWVVNVLATTLILNDTTTNNGVQVNITITGSPIPTILPPNEGAPSPLGEIPFTVKFVVTDSLTGKPVPNATVGMAGLEWSDSSGNRWNISAVTSTPTSASGVTSLSLLPAIYQFSVQAKGNYGSYPLGGSATSKPPGVLTPSTVYGAHAEQLTVTQSIEVDVQLVNESETVTNAAITISITPAQGTPATTFNISGNEVDASGKPVEGDTITLYFSNPAIFGPYAQAYMTATTDANGNFQFSLPPPSWTDSTGHTGTSWDVGTWQVYVTSATGISSNQVTMDTTG